MQPSATATHGSGRKGKHKCWKQSLGCHMCVCVCSCNSAVSWSEIWCRLHRSPASRRGQDEQSVVCFECHGPLDVATCILVVQPRRLSPAAAVAAPEARASRPVFGRVRARSKLTGSPRHGVTFLDGWGRAVCALSPLGQTKVGHDGRTDRSLCRKTHFAATPIRLDP